MVEPSRQVRVRSHLLAGGMEKSVTGRRRGWLGDTLLRLGLLTVVVGCAWGVHEVAAVGIAHAAELSAVGFAHVAESSAVGVTQVADSSVVNRSDTAAHQSPTPPSVPDVPADALDVATVVTQLAAGLDGDLSVYQVAAYWLAGGKSVAHSSQQGAGYVPLAPLSPAPASSGLDSRPTSHSSAADLGPAAWAPPPARSQLTRRARATRRPSRSPRPRSRPA